MKWYFIHFLYPFAKVISIKNKGFQKIAKVFFVNFVQKAKFTRIKSAKFREFLVSQNFLYAKPSALKGSSLEVFSAPRDARIYIRHFPALLEATLEAGSSNWLTTLPIKEHGFYLEKQAFWDTLYLRYNIQLRNLPSHCVCGKTFSIDHALSCPKGGFISLRHNELRDFTAKSLLTQVDITGKTFQHASTVTTDEARVDIAARGVCVKGQMALFDVRVFNPIAKVYLTSDLSSA